MPIYGSMYVRSAHINKAVNEEVVDLCRVISLRVSNWSFRFQCSRKGSLFYTKSMANFVSAACLQINMTHSYKKDDEPLLNLTEAMSSCSREKVHKRGN
jgi:hypothetical protein